MSPTISWFPASGALRRLCARCKAQQISPFNTSRRLNSSFLAPSSRTSNQERHNTNANFVATMKSTPSVKEPPPQPLMDEIDNPLEWLHPMRPYKPRTGRITIHADIPSAQARCREPLKAVAAAEFSKLDPSGARRRLFEKNSPDAIHVRDIIMVRTRTGDPFSGVVLRIQRKQHDSSVLLRNTITGVGVEREFKIFSPNVIGIEVVQRRPKKPVQTRLFYMRKSPHDIGSVDGIVKQYLKQKSALGTAARLTKTTPFKGKPGRK